jgi:hypothetical protein
MLRLASFKLASVVALSVLLSFVMASAQTVLPLKYEKHSEVKVKGVVDEVKEGVDNNVHLALKGEKGSLDVIVAPVKFLKEMEITFAKGDSIEVLGSQVTVDGNSAMLAREVIRNGDVMVMRDENGKPVWVGWIK